MSSLSLVVGVVLLQTAAAVVSFGTGNAGSVCLGAPVRLFEHKVSKTTNVGIMSHFWTTGSSEQQLAAAGLELRITYDFDGAESSISFVPAKAAGQFFGALNITGEWTDGTRAATPANTTMFAAGDKIGKNAVTQGWWNQFKMPFQKTVNVTVSVVQRPGSPVVKAPEALCASYYVVVRGYEQAASLPLLTLPSGMVLPSSARLHLQETDVVAAPGAFTSLLTVSAGHEALLYSLGLGLETSPPWGTQVGGKLAVRNNYVEGCWSLLRTHDEELPGQVLGTGLEDFWDSGYGFSLVAPGESCISRKHREA